MCVSILCCPESALKKVHFLKFASLSVGQLSGSPFLALIGFVMASRSNSGPSPSRPYHLAVPNFRMYEAPEHAASHPIENHLPAANTSARPHGAPNGITSAFASIETRLRDLEKRSSESDGLTRRLVEDAQRSIKDIRNKLLDLGQTSEGLSDRVDASNDRIDASNDRIDASNDRVDTLFAECARQCVESLVRPMTVSLKELLGTIVTPASNSNRISDQVSDTGTSQSSSLTADRETETHRGTSDQRGNLHDCNLSRNQVAHAASSTTGIGATTEGEATTEASKRYPTRRRKGRTSVRTSSQQPWANRLRPK